MLLSSGRAIHPTTSTTITTTKDRLIKETEVKFSLDGLGGHSGKGSNCQYSKRLVHLEIYFSKVALFTPFYKSINFVI